MQNSVNGSTSIIYLVFSEEIDGQFHNKHNLYTHRNIFDIHIEVSERSDQCINFYLIILVWFILR